MRTRVLFLLIILITFLGQTFASVKSDLETANKNGNAVFLVVSDPGVSETSKILDIANQAKSKLTKTVVIQMNRSDQTNAELVTKFGLAGAPLPVILVIASNGIVTAGYTLNQVTSELLVKAIPSPKREPDRRG